MLWRMLPHSLHLLNNIGRNEKKRRLVLSLVLVKVQLRRMSWEMRKKRRRILKTRPLPLVQSLNVKLSTNSRSLLQKSTL